MKNKKLILIIAVVIIALAGGAYFFINKSGDKVVFKEVAVSRGDIVITIQASGTVSPQNRLEIKPPIAGRVEEVLVKEGVAVKKGKVLAWISSSERAALLDSVRTQGAVEIKKWEELYKPTPVIAPISGTIILRNVESGQSFTNVDSIFTMADRLTIKAQVDETDIAQIKVGQKAKITLDAYPGNPVEGSVVHVAYDATITNNVTTYVVDVLPDDVPEFMRSGMTSIVNIQIDRKENVLILPLTSIITDQEGARVRVKAGKKSNMIPIETGSDDSRMVEVKSGLLESDIVLVEESVKKFGGSKSGSPFMPMKGGGGRRR